MKDYDIAVIGLGAIGAAAIYQLSKTDLRIVGIDKFAPPHTLGSSFGESRVSRHAIAEDERLMPVIKRADEIWKEIEEVSREQLYVHCGMMIAGYGQHTFMKESLRVADKFGINYQLLNEKEVERLFPAINAVGKGQTYYYEPEAGYLKPEVCISTELSLARNNGAQLLLNTEVTSIDESGDGVKLSLSSGEMIRAEKVIIASGPWIKEMLSGVLSPVLKTLLQTLYWFDIDKAHYEELTPGKLPVYLCGDDKTSTTRSFYGFPALNGPDGGVKFAVHETEVEASPNEKNRTEPVTAAEELYEYVSRYIKYIKPTVIRSANCLYTMTPDENFILDSAPNSERIIIASACSGHGFKHSAATGEIAAQLATNDNTTIDTGQFSLDRF